MDTIQFLENKTAQKKISIISIPLDIGSDNKGMNQAPEYLLKSGLVAVLENGNHQAKVLPALRLGKMKDKVSAIFKVAKDANRLVSQQILAGRKVLAIGGDHAVSLGTIGGAADAVEGDLGVIWIDAHPDLHTFESSDSQAVHGMVSAGLLGFDKRLSELVKTKVKKQNFLYVGLKDLDQAEVDRIRKHKLQVISMFDIFEHGFSEVTEKIKQLQKRVKNIWVSFDVDSMDELYAPASAMASSGGLTYREAVNLLTFIGKSCNVIGMDIVELTPKKDRGNQTATLCLEVVAAAFGTKYNWYTEYMNIHGKH